MKKIIYLSFFVALLAISSCSKDTKINKKIEGIWNVTVYEGIAVPTNDKITYQFLKSTKKEGTGTLSFKDEVGNNIGINFIYNILDKKLNITTTSLFNSNTSVIYEIKEYSKTKLKIVNTVDGELTEMEKK